ncbi:MAG: transporter substrate-binding domain-containing protein [Hyphomicrobiaceae bacterium]
MRVFVKAAAAAVVAVGLGAGAASAQDVVKFGVAAEPYPPFSSQDASGKWVGWEMDLMDAVCAEAQLKCELVATAWDGIIPALLAKNIDVIWSSMSITDERKQQIDFTDMYYNTPTVLVGAKNGDMDITPAHLSGKTIGVQVSTTHSRYAEKFFAPAGATVKTYQTLDEHNQDLAAGRIDYVQGDGSAMDAFLQSDQGKECCELKGQVPDDPETLGLGVGGGIRKEDSELLGKLNAAIHALGKSGKIDEITNKYPELVGKMITPKE